MGLGFGITIGVDFRSVESLANETMPLDAISSETGFSHQEKDHGPDEGKSEKEQDPADPRFRASSFLRKHPDHQGESNQKVAEQQELAEESVFADLLQGIEHQDPAGWVGCGSSEQIWFDVRAGRPRNQ